VTLRPNDARRIASAVQRHFDRHRRDMPWRRSRDPYAIWVSEVMLQQTRVATVIPYFERWLARFPTVDALASAPEDDVLAAWSGLGYYSRARNLHACAKEVVARYRGALPSEPDELRTLPGIGRYTAGAIASVAFGVRTPVVDGNVERVLSRVLPIEDDIKSSGAQKRLWAAAGAIAQHGDPSKVNQGLMELGATLCTPRDPSCGQCPIRSSCSARDDAESYPRKRKRMAARDKRKIAVVAGWVERNGKIALGLRRTGGLYGGLWELPSASTVDDLADLFAGDLEPIGKRASVRERAELSHRRLEVRVLRCALHGALGRASRAQYQRVTWHRSETLDELALSSVTRKIIGKMRRRT